MMGPESKGTIGGQTTTVSTVGGRLVGREDELDQLSNVVTDAARRGVCFCAIRGEAGVGKTALVESYLSATGIDPVICRFGVGEGGLHRLRQAFDHPDTGDGFPAAQIDRNEARPDPLGEPEPDGAVERNRVVGALATRLIDVAGTDQQVIMLDDLQLADPVELEVVEAMLSRAADSPGGRNLAVLATVRPMPSEAPVSGFLDRIGRRGWSSVMELRSLEFDEVAQLLRDEGVDANPVSVVAPVLSASAGNALHIKALAAELRAGRADWGPALPAGLSAAVGDWIGQLDQQDRFILGAAGTFSDEFTDDEVAAVAGVSAEEADGAIDRALTAQILVERGRRLAFAHSLIRTELASTLPRRDRATINARCAESVTEDHERPDEERVMLRARHLEAAGGAVSAAERHAALVAAGDVAFESFRWTTAASCFGAAIKLESDVTVDPAEAVRIRLRAGRANEWAYANEEAVALYQEVADLPASSTEQRFWAAYWRCHLLTVRPSGKAGRVDLGDLRPFLGPEADPRHRVLSLVLFAEEANIALDVDRGRDYGMRAVSEAVRLGDPLLLGRTKWMQGAGELNELAPDLGRDALEQGRAAGDAAADLLVCCWTRNRLGLAALLEGKHEEAIVHARDGGERANSLQVFGELAYAAAVEACADAIIGDFRQAVRMAEKAVRFFEHSQFGQVQYAVYPMLLWAHLQRGDHRTARAELAEWLDRSPPSSSRYRQVLAAEEGSVEPLRPWRPGRRFTMLGAGMALLDADLLHRQGVEDPAPIVEDLLRLDEAGIVASPTWPVMPGRLAAQLLLQAGQLSEGAAVADSTADRARQLGLVPELASTLVVRGELLAGLGMVDDARQSASEALVLAERLGMHPTVFSARRLSHRLTAAAADPRKDGELRIVLVTDVVGSTTLSVTAGDEIYAAAMEGHIELASDIIDSTEGIVFDTSGDGLLAWFSDPAKAKAAAVEIQRQNGHRREADPELQVRIGLATGYPFQRGDRIYGASVNLAARVCAAARPDSIFVTEDLAGRSASPTVFNDEGLHTLKGFPEPVRLLSLT